MRFSVCVWVCTSLLVSVVTSDQDRTMDTGQTPALDPEEMYRDMFTLTKYVHVYLLLCSY